MHKIAAIWTSHTNSSMGPVGPATMTHGVDSGGGGWGQADVIEGVQ